MAAANSRQEGKDSELKNKSESAHQDKEETEYPHPNEPKPDAVAQEDDDGAADTGEEEDKDLVDAAINKRGERIIKHIGFLILGEGDGRNRIHLIGRVLLGGDYWVRLVCWNLHSATLVAV